MMNKIFATIEKHNMLPAGSNVIVALSGGADSITLLHFLYSNRDRLKISVEAAHINHNIRGSEALRDQHFVETLCKSRGIKLSVFSENIPALAKETGESLEECGRRIRYEKLEAIDASSLIATAHNLDDSAETAIINLVRGTGIKGLCGISAVRRRIIRPLIDCSKSEILGYCKKFSLEFVTDSTNEINDYTRNKIRNSVFPILKEINPSFLNTFSRISVILSEEADYIAESAEKLMQSAFVSPGVYSVEPLLSAHPALRKTAIGFIAKNITGIQCESLHIMQIDSILKKGGYVNIPCSKTIKSDGRLFSEYVQEQKSKFYKIEVNDFKNEYKINKKIVHFNKKYNNINKLQKINNQVFINLADYDTMNGNIVLRTRIDGDKVRLSSRNCTKTLKKLFNEAKIPPHKRDNILILSDDEGIIWIEGFGVSERCAVTDGTLSFLEINIEEGGN